MSGFCNYDPVIRPLSRVSQVILELLVELESIYKYRGGGIVSRGLNSLATPTPRFGSKR